MARTLSPAQPWHAAAPKSRGIGIVAYAKQTYKAFSDDDALTLGASLAYYEVFSLAPLLLTVISIAGLIMGREAVQDRIQNQIQALIGSGSGDQIKIMLTKATEHHSSGVIGTVVGLIVLLVGATGTFGSLQDALNRIWHVKPDPKAGGIKAFIGKRILSFGMILGVAFLLLVSLAMSALLAAAGTWIGGMLPSWLSSSLLQAAGFAASLLVITALFSAMFKILPDVKLTWREVWVGALVTSVLFTIGKTLIGLYLGKSATASAYGAAGSFVVIVVWLYYASVIMLFGAEFTKIWAVAHGRRIEPEPGAISVQ